MSKKRVKRPERYWPEMAEQDDAELTDKEIMYLALEKMIREGKVQSYYDSARRMMMFRKVGVDKPDPNDKQTN
jgi:hypothetical protein